MAPAAGCPAAPAMPGEALTASPDARVERQRIRFVDVLRGLAVLMMVETHVVNALLHPRWRETAWFPTLHFVNGLVAPSFLFLAGFAFAVVADRKWDDFLGLRRPLLHNVRRLGLILFLGYLLHFQVGSLRSLLAGGFTPDRWLRFFQSDILHCISITLSLLVGLVVVLRVRRRVVVALLLLALGVVLATPSLWGSSAAVRQRVPAFLAAFLVREPYSLFPLFPWSAYLLLGGVVGFAYLAARRRGEASEARFIARLAVLGGLLVAAALGLQRSGLDHRLFGSIGVGGPAPVGLRLGCVLLVATGVWVLVERFRIPAPGLELAGQESLFLYVVHLVIVYGSVFVPTSLRRIYGTDNTMAFCILVTVVLCVALYAMTVPWHRLKEQPPRMRRVQVAIVATVAGWFLVRGAF